MPSLPPARHCLFAEQVRPEVGGKSTILGFAGISPFVTIEVPAFPALINICAYLLCEEASSNTQIEAAVEAEGPQGPILPKTKVSVPSAETGKTVSCAFNFGGFPINAPGVYRVRIFSDEMVHSEHSFSVRQAGSPYIKPNNTTDGRVAQT